MFKKILIANRGEIACRVAATARRMGIQTVAVYSEPDAMAMHVAMCDEAVAIGAAAVQESYLHIDRIIGAAVATGAEAVHPGYGFLSENEAFAAACAQAGLVFIGPPASAIGAMGSKSAAKSLMEKANVPLVPGYHGENQDADFLQQQADKIGYPVLLKASAGGGGKGMRIVGTQAEFKAALASCQREAINSFGDDKVLVEKYLQRPRHIEIQVFADTKGECVYLFERDCSVQRRHQKVLEEAPAPGMTAERRQAMGNAAVAAAKAVGYVGAGTVEFIANQDGSFYFMEMNTRLQVEHPVTEMITGLDLVEWQLKVAYGLPLPKKQHELAIQGHAIEARIYAENPEKGFLPSTGRLQYVHTPEAVHFTSAGSVRIDSGVRAGDMISPYYDPMIAKLIVWGEDREQALQRMAQALTEYQVAGLATNIAFLARLVNSKAFVSADLDTGLIERHHDALFPALQPAPFAVLAIATATLLDAERGAVTGDPWTLHAGWRMNGLLARAMHFSDHAGDYTLQVMYQQQQWMLVHQHHDSVLDEVQVMSIASHEKKVQQQNGAMQVLLRLDGKVMQGTVVRDKEIFHIFHAGHHWQLHWHDPIAHAGETEDEGGRLTAPMPGKIIALLVEQGATVEKGTPLLTMEAMKMEHTIYAPHAGKVLQVLYAVGDQVIEGEQLLALGIAEEDK